MKFVAALLISCLSILAAAQDGVSSAGAARSRYLDNRGILPNSSDIVVEDIVNYHRHELARPKAGEAVAIDLAWQKEFSAGEPAVLQIGLSTALLNDKAHLRPLNLSLVIDKSGSMADADKMNRVKQALLTLLTQLRPTDIVSLVEFDTNADVLVPAQALGDGAPFRNAIQVMQPGSSTNLYDGLVLGYKEALKNKRAGWTNRVVLLTDGIANQGVIDPGEIASGSKRFNDQGIDLSTIGLGLDLNKDLLEHLAKSGRGLFHFVADGQDVDKVFVREVQSLVSPVATDPNLEIELDPSIRVDQLYGYSPERNGNRISLKLDNMNSGMTEVVLLKLASARTQAARELPVKVKLRYFDLQKNAQVVKTTSTVLQIRDGAAPSDPEVTKNYTIAELAQSMKDMAQACEKELYAQAELNLGQTVSDTVKRYPNEQDPDIRRVLNTAQQYLAILKDKASDSLAKANILPNGDFSQGNQGFTSELVYRAPRVNALWEGGYTVMPQFNSPQLHTNVPGVAYAAPRQRTGTEQVFYANTGGTGAMTVWKVTVACKPNTTYRLSFQGISLTAGREWIPSFEIQVNGYRGAAQAVPDGSFGEVTTTWYSGKATSATVSIVRAPMDHWGGLIGIANIEMSPVAAHPGGR